MSGQSSDNFIERLRAREHEAFNRLVMDCHTSVYRLAYRLLRNADDAQDVAQESFLAAYEGIGGFQQRASIKTWLLSITYRKAVDRVRKRAEESHIGSDALDDAGLWKIAQSVESFTDWGVNPEQSFSNDQMKDHLRAALNKLPAQSKAVFELRDLQGFSSKETSDILGINEGAVRVRLHRVRQFLMSELQTLFGGKGRPR